MGLLEGDCFAERNSLSFAPHSKLGELASCEPACGSDQPTATALHVLFRPLSQATDM